MWSRIEDYLPIQEASCDFGSMWPSCSNWGKRIALNPKTVPILRDAKPDTMHAAKYCKKRKKWNEKHWTCSAVDL